MSYKSEISGLIKSNHGTGALYIGLSAMVLADALPSPMDALFFYTERINKNKFANGEITPSQYWRRKTLAYYGFDTLWWLFLLGLAVAVKGTTKDKLTVVAGVLGAGAVIGVVHKNIIKDEEQIQLSQEKLSKLISEHPEFADLIAQFNNQQKQLSKFNLKK